MKIFSIIMIIIAMICAELLTVFIPDIMGPIVSAVVIGYVGMSVINRLDDIFDNGDDE